MVEKPAFWLPPWLTQAKKQVVLACGLRLLSKYYFFGKIRRCEYERVLGGKANTTQGTFSLLIY
jgi:hypothetical protein